MTPKKMVKVAKGKELPKKKVSKMRKAAGGGNVGDYKNVKKSDFAGPAGDSPQYSFPINNISRARSALKLAHYAPDPTGIKRAVYKKYPQLNPKHKNK